VRNLRFATNADEIPRHWHGGKKSVTAFFNTLSVFFPAGERFFVDAVKAHKHLVTNEKLKDDVARFCAQEGIHAREHDRYNAMLERHGYPAAALARRVDGVLDRARRVLPKRTQLAATCALEHFTALMAHFLLDDGRLLEGVHPAMRALWLWHAAEEAEHRAVAFDVYRAAKGPYLERATVMLLASVIFWALVIQFQATMMKTDGTKRSLNEWRELYTYLFVEPGGLEKMGAGWLDYFRPGFHPLDHDNSALIEAWKAAHARFEGELRA
jgi:uncharacterized protein